MVFHKDGKSRCKASLTYFEDAIGKSRKTVIATRDKLIEDDLIIMHKDNITDSAEYEVNHRYLATIQTTPPNLITSVKTPPALVEKLHQPSGETTLVASVKTPHNTNINNNTNININNNILVDFYNSTCTQLPKLLKLTDTRKKKLQARLKEYSEQELKDMFLKASKSDFLNGKNGNNWKASFDWLLEPRNIVKVIEGNYDNKKEARFEPKKVLANRREL